MHHLKLLNRDGESVEAQWKAAEVRRHIDLQVAEVICLTETETGRLMPHQDGHDVAPLR